MITLISFNRLTKGNSYAFEARVRRSDGFRGEWSLPVSFSNEDYPEGSFLRREYGDYYDIGVPCNIPGFQRGDAYEARITIPEDDN